MTLGRRALRSIAFWGLTFGIACVMGAAPVDAPSVVRGVTAAPTWLEHWDLAQSAIVLLFGLALWFSSQKLNRIDKKFDLLFTWRDEISTQVTALQAEHDVMKNTCGVGQPRRRRGE